MAEMSDPPGNGPATPLATAPTTPPPAPPAVDETGATLRAYVEKMQKRIDLATNIFNQNEFTPFASKAFKKFIVDHYSEVTMRFILMGIVRDGDEATTEAKLKKQGFTVSGAAPDAPAKEPEQTGYVAPSMPMPQEDTAGVLNEDHPLIRQARELGFDPTKDPEEP